MASETREPDTGSVDSLPIDVELISDIVDDVLGMRLSTSTREDIDFKTSRVTGPLNLLLTEDFGADDDGEIRSLFRRAYRLLDMSKRPGEQATSFEAFSHLHNLATITRSLLSVYAKIGASPHEP
ncbi:hypothetical protein [Streptomyces sp. NPDC014622]|uniref:hypothetical protein n=1 Tax=Streptomyces sp. NPDC014622 TaxID=3364874 RepID=UPI003701EB2C